MQSNENDRLQKSERNKSFTGTWEPAGIMTTELLNDSEKRLLSLVYNLAAGNACQAGNEFIARRLGWKTRKTERIITDLKVGGWINITASGSPYRKIYLTSKTSELVENWTDEAPVYSAKSDGVEKFQSAKNDGVTPPNLTVYSAKSGGVTPPNLTDIYKYDNNKIENIIENNTPLVSEIQEAEVIEEKLDVDFILTPPTPITPTKPKKKTRTVGDDQFERCWKMFEGYGSKKKALEYWEKLSQADRDGIEAKIPDYVASTPGCEFRKMFEGWINPENELWKRPIVRRRSEQKFSVNARNENIKRDLEAIEKNPEIIHVSGFDRDQALLKKLFNY